VASIEAELASGTGLFGSGHGRNVFDRIQRGKQDQRNKQGDDFLNEVRKNTTISDPTRNEIISQLGSGDLSIDNFTAAKNLFTQAKDGTSPLFKSRQLVKQQRVLTAERPGRLQTILSR